MQDHRKNDLQKAAEISINEKYKLKTEKQNLDITGIFRKCAKALKIKWFRPRKETASDWFSK